MRLKQKITAPCFLLFLVLCNQRTTLATCTEYMHYADSDIKEYVSILQDTKKTEIERSFAYENLACSDDPVYRQLALKIGLQDASATILRSKILMDAMMTKDTFVIDLFESPNLSKESKSYVKEHNHQIRFQAYMSDPIQGCISIYSRTKCLTGRQIKITGRHVDITYIKFYGSFELTSNNELEGYVISTGRPKTEKISAKMILF